MLARRLLAPLLLALVPSAFATGAQEELRPEEVHGETAVAILANLGGGHYRELSIDDAFSTDVLERYLEALDPARHVFLQEDVVRYRREYATALDELLKLGNVKPAFEIYNRYRERRSQQLDFYEELVGRLEQLDFTKPESLEVDREDAPWPASQAEAIELWRKRFKNDVLAQRLDGRDAEAIEKSLTRRYENQRRMVDQTRSRDVFGLFMNIVAGAFDPHTSYFAPRDVENFDIAMSLSVSGIGALLQADGEYTKIQRIIPGGPAEKSGALDATDRIVGVGEGPDGEMVDVVGWRTDEVADLIRGEKGTTVRLEVLAAEAPEAAKRTVVIVRDQVALEEQAAQFEVVEIERDGRTYEVGVIDLPAFYVDFEAARNGDPDFRSSTRDVEQLIVELATRGVDGIVMDLRGNGGGSLTEAQSLTGLFVGRKPVVQVKNTEDQVQLLGSQGPVVYDGPLIVLVDRISASASEIFAAAIQDLGRGVVVGSSTFGKGTVQALLPLDHGELKLTRAKFYRISGGSTQAKGVEPDVEFLSLYDPEEIGESSLPEALPWDTVDAVRGVRKGKLPRLIPDLRDRHEARAAKSPAFAYYRDRLAFFDEAETRTEVSLVEAERKAQVERDEVRLLAIENRWREARGLEPVEKLEDIERDDEELDPYAREAAEVLVDLVTLKHLARR